MNNFSTRAEILYKRTYSRPLNSEGTKSENWVQTVDRVITHQAWLWERELDMKEGSLLTGGGRRANELKELRQLMLNRKVLLAGRTMWLGGTDLSKRRQISQFNCSHLNVETVYDLVDLFWLLLNGSGVGATPKNGTLNGFSKKINDIEVIRSTRTKKSGIEHNTEKFDNETKTWTIILGDSGEAWAKAIGKLIAGKYPANKLILDFSRIRPGGGRLSQYGWISAGDNVIAEEMLGIVEVLNRRAGQLLSKMDLLDIINHLGVIQTGRRGAEIVLMNQKDREWHDFATAKKDFWKHGLDHRAQSNNTLVFYEKPTLKKLKEVLEIMLDSGGSEPGIANGDAALKRAPWFKGLNPCAEILLANKALCNLVEVDLAAFKDDPGGLRRAIHIVSRANYRQTCVDLDDGVLQRAWHENNEYLRLCGVGLCGIARRPDISAYEFRTLRNYAISGTYSMAEELGRPLPKATTTIKPGGTIPKVMDTTEGITTPEGQYIFNNINFSKADPLVEILRSSGYRTFNNPNQQDAVVVTIPTYWKDIEFQGGVNRETAIDQLQKYKLLMDNYVDHNVSSTVKYKPEDIGKIAGWLDDNWDHYVAAAFLLKQDVDKSAEELGFEYLPQEVVSEDRYREYVSQLKPVNVSDADSEEEIDDGDCATGVCPVR